MAQIFLENLNCQQKLDALTDLLKQVNMAPSLPLKLAILSERHDVQKYLGEDINLQKQLPSLSIEERFVVLSLLSLGQGAVVFQHATPSEHHSPRLRALIKTLLDLEHSYDNMGGIIGYHLTILTMIFQKQSSSPLPAKGKIRFHKPIGIDISVDSAEVRQAIKAGVLSMSSTAHIYPVGGAGDRLNLQDERTGDALPAAELLFGGRTLLEGLIRDLQAREYLHYKLTGRQQITPIALMTSQEKNNREHITKICNQHCWFGRPTESFLIFEQPLVPMLTVTGEWAVQAPLQLILKPGGHGVIWKLAKDHGILDHLIATGYHYAIVRQINNPISGTDYGLCALQGWGIKNKKAFGFASCERRVNASEGVDILIEEESSSGFCYRISNIEYTEFEASDLKDEPIQPGSVYSQYPANTNILFVELKSIKKAIESCPIPGLLINMKNTVSHLDAHGKRVEHLAGRLESTMQNIADYITSCYPKPLEAIRKEHLRSFITYQDRRKTISVTKKTYVTGESSLETPEGCFYEMLQNHEQLLSVDCQIKVPHLCSVEEYLQKGPNFLFFFHPVLGPLYQVIAQKLRQGTLASGAELQLEIAELDIIRLHLDGSLIITADSPLGQMHKLQQIRYGENNGKCELHGVTIQNKGINREVPNIYWKNQIARHEILQIILEGNAEFYAEDVSFNGAHEIRVPNGHRLSAFMQGGIVHYKLEKISSPTWYWNYAFDHEDRIILSKSTAI